MRRRWLPPAVPVDEEAEVMSKLAAVIIKSPANEEDNVAAMIDSTEKIFDAILDRECKLATLERLLKARNPPLHRPEPPTRLCRLTSSCTRTQYYTAYLRDPDGVKRRRAVQLMDVLLDRFIDTEAQKEEKLREVRRLQSPSLARGHCAVVSPDHAWR
jgi:hypothetical protein